jgi:hypothetical protein
MQFEEDQYGQHPKQCRSFNGCGYIGGAGDHVRSRSGDVSRSCSDVSSRSRRGPDRC